MREKSKQEETLAYRRSSRDKSLRFCELIRIIRRAFSYSLYPRPVVVLHPRLFFSPP